VVDSVSSYQDIPPGVTAEAQTPFRIEVSEDWPSDRSVPLELFVTCGDSTRTWSVPPLATVTGALAIEEVDCLDSGPGGDGNGDANAGESPELVLTLMNATSSELSSIEGSVSSADPWVAVTTASTAFPDLAAGGFGSNSSAPLGVSVAPDALPGHHARLRVRVSADASTYTYAETLDFMLEIVGDETALPSGPDPYGYYAYDSSDTLYSSCPVYDWVDIAPPGPGYLIPMVSVLDEGVRPAAPPFLIRHYGESRYFSTVSSNGLMALNQSSSFHRVNTELPSPFVPSNTVAPFWDDLDPSAGGEVYSWCDMEGHRFVIQYENVRRKHTEDTVTFQLIIYDQDYFPTPTGDAPIVFQYEIVACPDSCTVGIVGAGRRSAFQYAFDGDYASNATPLADGLAIRFTTVPPETLNVPWLTMEDVEVDDSVGGNGDGAPCPGETLRLVVELANLGNCPAEDIELTLACSDSAIAVLEGTTSLPDIAAGESARNDTDPFVLWVAGTPADSLARLWLEFGGNASVYQKPLLCHLRVGPEPVGVTPRLALHTCRPNPFKEGTLVSFDLPDEIEAEVRVYDVAGRMVRTLHDGPGDAGPNLVNWDGTNVSGDRVASGVYFIKLSASGDSRTQKVVLLR
jgi:hypothetical protein